MDLAKRLWGGAFDLILGSSASASCSRRPAPQPFASHPFKTVGTALHLLGRVQSAIPNRFRKTIILDALSAGRTFGAWTTDPVEQSAKDLGWLPGSRVLHNLGLLDEYKTDR
jgi:hypothetical protein